MKIDLGRREVERVELHGEQALQAGRYVIAKMFSGQHLRGRPPLASFRSRRLDPGGILPGRSGCSSSLGIRIRLRPVRLRSPFEAA
ncbi:hypothetical protein [Aromatoleum aromaticum]|uniref:Uncharacterized protein n=1 Tax=Aromatoleum aromaticum (strain DSM 19018 / LMG 30748 / EbN1) TaxID=76114 RepID=Q5P034_AROAE|nr:hypothetical protein [Aromatoleum aromaticum]NMG54856.1 hypothetical protein [Aromatoleum aromaticum]CAI09330.1 hypothetical protein ebB199 [Aromatoleum aromaticum EbN1]